MNTMKSKGVAPMRKQRGFTLIEIAIVSVLLLILIAIILPNLTQQSEDTKVSQSQLFLGSSVCRAVTSFAAASNGKIDGANVAALQLRGVPQTTPWGAAWTVTDTSSTDNLITFNFPMTNVRDPAAVATSIIGGNIQQKCSVVSGTPAKNPATGIPTSITVNYVGT